MSQLKVYSSGKGPDLALLHGWGLHAGVWDSLIERLSRDFTCHAIDLPGHGQSPADCRGLNNWTDAVVEVLPQRVWVLGWSLGGTLAMNMALRHAARVRGLLLMATTPRFLRASDWQHGQKPASLHAMAQGLENDYVTTLHEFLILQMLGQPGARVLMRQLRQSLLDRPPQVSGLQAGLDILESTDLRPRIQEIAQPALVVAGERDRLTHPAAARWLVEHLPQAELWALSKSAHAPFISHERDCAERIRDFVHAS